MNPIIELKDVTVSYRESIALNSISFKVSSGEFVIIAGPNGSGKTTLLTAINGLGRILKGSADIFGLRLNSRSATRIRKDIGYVPQVLNIDPRMPISVEEAVAIGRCARKGFFQKMSFEDKDIIDKAMAQSGIANLSKRPIGHLSGGEQRKVAIARALAQEPRILLLDEPISNLDLNAQSQIFELIEKIHQKMHLTTLLVIHHLDLIPASCQRIVMLKEARIIFDGRKDEALDEKILSELYACRIEVFKNGFGITVRAKG